MNRVAPRLRALLMTLPLAALASGEHTAPASLVVYGAIWTGDAGHPEVRALAARGDTIIATGDSAGMTVPAT